MRINGTVYYCPSGLLKPMFLSSSFSASVVKEQGVYWEGITLTLNCKFYKSRFLSLPLQLVHVRLNLTCTTLSVIQRVSKPRNESWLGTYIVHSETDKQDTTTSYEIRITSLCPSPFWSAAILYFFDVSMTSVNHETNQFFFHFLIKDAKMVQKL